MHKFKFIFVSLLATILAGLLGGCLVRQKVTRNGAVVSDGYAFKRPLKEAFENSQ